MALNLVENLLLALPTKLVFSIVRWILFFLTVLVAHGGFDNDFMMLQSNIDRHEMDLEILNQFRFADTYLLAKKVKMNS